jgi:dihydrofolate synthase/folylpolyglutamate synthase
MATRPKKTRDSASKPARRRPAITGYAQAVRYLYDRTNVELMRVVRHDDTIFKLERMRQFLALLGDPQDALQLVHVAGTVGKGSTVGMLASMLRGCGYTVGEFTSPHVLDVRERITIDGSSITRNDFTDLIANVASAAVKLDFEPTFFEIMTAAGLKQFADQAVDIAVVEVGLGGRLDCTNVVTPMVSAITCIDFDHTNLLGKTLPEIAREKAGIMKPGVPAISCEQVEEVDTVLRAEAERIGAPLRVVNKEIEFSCRFGAAPGVGPHTRVCLLTDTCQFMHMPVPMPGEHQAMNCAVALAVIDILRGKGFELPEMKLHEGLARTSLLGRMELVWDRPRILVDGAHNAASMGALMRSVGVQVPYDSMVCIFGCCQDKDVPAMLDKVALGADKVIFTRTRTNPRAADPDDLQRTFAERCGKMSQVAASLPEALDLASRATGRDDLICVTGSFYLVGEAKKHLADLDRKRNHATVVA